MKIKYDSEPVYDGNDNYIKRKIKMYDGNVNTNLQDKGMLKEKASCKCLSIIMLVIIIIILLEECKYELKKSKMENLIDDDLEKNSSD